MAQDEKKQEKQGSQSQSEIDFHYIKTDNYRTFHVDGAFGGPTPNGQIYISLFIERAPIPEIVRHKINADGTISEEVSRIGKKGVVRETEAGLIMSLEVAKILQNWLNQKIIEAETKLVPPSKERH